MGVKKKETGQETVMVGRKPIAPEKKKDINIKVTRDVHKRLKKLLYHQPSEWSVDPAMDLGDCFEKVLEFWKANHRDD